MKSQLVVGLILSMGLLANQAHAAKLKSFCTVPENGGSVTGINIEERLPIASVSKVFTSLFAITQMPINRKVYTQFYYTHLGNGVYDVHIQGGIEPYFNRESMQWLISKLNEVGVTKINILSYDENFKYLHLTEKAFSVTRLAVDPVTKKKKNRRLFYDPVSGKNELAGPNPDAVGFQLGQTAFILANYNVTKAMAAKDGKTLVKQLFFAPKTIKFVAVNEFKAAATTKKAFIASPDLLHMIKLMNWKSNNHASDKMLLLGGGLSKFNSFYHDNMKFTESDLRFINGSGQNADLGGRLYNEATCSSVLRALNGLKKNLEKQNAKLEDALAVIGGDIGSTFSGKYITDATRLSVIAKTGTVGTNVTLAGMISAKTGNHFFFYNVETLAATGRQGKGKNSSAVEANRSRAIIAQHLNSLIQSKEFGGPNPINYKIKVYDTEKFDEEGTEAELVETISEEGKSTLTAADVPVFAIDKNAPPIGIVSKAKPGAKPAVKPAVVKPVAAKPAPAKPAVKSAPAKAISKAVKPKADLAKLDALIHSHTGPDSTVNNF